jgi:hypothetical protein
MSLPEFLLARIADDEDAAKGPLTQKWFAVGTEFPDDDSHPSEMLRGYVDSKDLAVTEDGDGPSVWHIARHDPARVLAECEAKRRIVDTVERMIADADDPDIGMSVKERLFAGTCARSIFRALILPYADHPDYQPEWRV